MKGFFMSGKKKKKIVETTIREMYGRNAVFKIISPATPMFGPTTDITGIITRVIETHDKDETLIFEIEGLSISLPVEKEEEK
jgi:hypothetical protein